MVKRALLVGFICVAIQATPAIADDQTPEQILQSLHYQKGHIEIVAGGATIDLGPDFAYLDPKDGTTFLTKVWNNPPDSVGTIEGMIVPTGVDLTRAEGWGVVLEYENSGHVSDSDAASINYDELLDRMKKETNEGNDARTKAGYQPILLLGWAQPPHYDAASKTIYWAKRMRFGDDSLETINYYIRALGRTGVLDLNVVASSEQLDLVNAKAPQLISMVAFKPGNQYADYQEGSDNTAAYGLAGLIAGGVLVKAGFFKGLLLLVAGFWKVIAIGAVAAFAGVGGAIKKRFSRSS